MIEHDVALLLCQQTETNERVMKEISHLLSVRKKYTLRHFISRKRVIRPLTLSVLIATIVALIIIMIPDSNSS